MNPKVISRRYFGKKIQFIYFSYEYIGNDTFLQITLSFKKGGGGKICLKIVSYVSTPSVAHPEGDGAWVRPLCLRKLAFALSELQALFFSRSNRTDTLYCSHYFPSHIIRSCTCCWVSVRVDRSVGIHHFFCFCFCKRDSIFSQNRIAVQREAGESVHEST